MAVKATFRTLGTKVPAELADRIRTAAETAGIPVSRWLADAARARLGDDPAPTGSQAGRQAPEPLSGDGPVNPLRCDHPKAKLNVQPYGTFCRACGGRVR